MFDGTPKCLSIWVLSTQVNWLPWHITMTFDDILLTCYHCLLADRESLISMAVCVVSKSRSAFIVMNLIPPNCAMIYGNGLCQISHYNSNWFMTDLKDGLDTCIFKYLALKRRAFLFFCNRTYRKLNLLVNTMVWFKTYLTNQYSIITVIDDHYIFRCGHFVTTISKLQIIILLKLNFPSGNMPCKNNKVKIFPATFSLAI